MSRHFLHYPPSPPTDISKVQDDEVGDGTTSVVVLASELLKVREGGREGGSKGREGGGKEEGMGSEGRGGRENVKKRWHV